MATANQTTPFIATHPGEIMKDELEAKNDFSGGLC
jgi:hypothetical protein